MGSYFAIEGVRCCVHGTSTSPLLVNAEEIQNKVATYDLVVQRKRYLFAAINDLALGEVSVCKACANLKSNKFKNVSFEHIGGHPMPSIFGTALYYVQSALRLLLPCVVE